MKLLDFIFMWIIYRKTTSWRVLLLMGKKDLQEELQQELWLSPLDKSLIVEKQVVLNLIFKC